MLQPTSALVNNRLSARFKAAGLLQSIKRFQSDERGSMTFFMIFIFCFMLLFGGIAVDMMRYETRRVAMQQTLDRAALSAASLTQAVDPQAVVDDYFAKAELDGSPMAEFATPVAEVTDGLAGESRKVRVGADVRSYNFFMNMFFLPIEYLEGPATTQAEQGAEQIEVMLVLDITGSMNESLGGGRTKMAGLKDAATFFINTLKDADTLNQVSIGIVPYNTQVNLGRSLRERFNATHIPTHLGVPLAGIPTVNCLEPPITPAAFGTTSISTTDPLPMSTFANISVGTNTSNDPRYTRWNVSGPGNPTVRTDRDRLMCPGQAYSEVMLPTKDPAPLLSKINSLQPGGRTSIMMGMRWGVALMDETMRPVYADLLSGEPGMVNRPANNNDPKTRKIIVLMTDGQHVATDFIRPAFKVGISPIFRSNVDQNFSIQLRPLTNPAPYWVPHLCPNSNGDTCTAGWRAQPWSNLANSGTARNLDWSEVWQDVRVTWVAWQLYARSRWDGRTEAAINTDIMNQFRSTTYASKGTMDALLQVNCSAAKASGFEVFGIAFAAGTDGDNQIRGCASSSGSDPTDKSNYFFRPQSNADLETAFADILSVISPLRLTE